MQHKTHFLFDFFVEAVLAKLIPLRLAVSQLHRYDMMILQSTTLSLWEINYNHQPS